ncbi:MAG: caspase family protein [Polyangiaceae bacterium]
MMHRARWGRRARVVHAVVAGAALAWAGCGAPRSTKSLEVQRSVSSVAAPVIASVPEWQPGSTRAFIVCLAGFEGEAPGHTSFTTSDRNDTAFAELLARRGVPRDRTTVLLDGAATTESVRAALERTLAESRPDETLLFYFGSHGGYDAKTGAHSFSTFDGSLPMEWAIDAIEASFKGDRAMLFSDSCYSGGLVELVQQRGHRVSYAVLSSAGSHDVAWSGWRFIDVLIRGLEGQSMLDLDQDGQILWSELTTYAEHHMAFVASGKPAFTRVGAAMPDFVLTRGVPKKTDPRVGLYREALIDGSWERVEILAVDRERLFVHPTSGVTHEADAWVHASSLREVTPPRYAKGAAVEVEYDSKWFPATVLDSFDELTFAHYEGYSSAWDEWFSPDEIRPRTAAPASDRE